MKRAPESDRNYKAFKKLHDTVLEGLGKTEDGPAVGPRVAWSQAFRPAVKRLRCWAMADGDYHFSTEVRVRLPETDAMGVVFHGNYFTYLEVGRVDYLLNLGLTAGNRPIRDFDNVVVAAHLDFRAPARLHDLLKIEVRVAEIRTTSIRFSFRILNRRSNVLVAEGHTVHCAIDDEFRPGPVPDSFRQTIDRYEHRG